MATVLIILEYTSDSLEPPLFLERFEPVNVTEKGTIRLVARVTGNPTPEVTWLRNNEPIEPSPRIQQSFDGTNIELVIKNADSEMDTGDYKCIASNSQGRASHGARINVDVETVKFTKKLKKTVDIYERETLTLECETSHTVTTKWFYNNTELTGMDHRHLIQEGKVHKLVIRKSTLEDTGSYKCTVKSQKTETSVTVKPTKPTFLKKLEDREVTEKEVAILEVEVSSDNAEVVWKKDGEVIPKDTDKFRIERDGGYRKLLIRSTSIHDEGEYSCTLPDEKCSAEVTVVELPPEIIQHMDDQTVTKGEKATFGIELTKGDALVRWFKDGNELQFSEHIQLSIDGKRQTLNIHNTELDDKGTYSCQVGNQKSQARLTVKDVPLKFVKELPDTTVSPINEDVTFTVEFNKPDVTVQWLRNGRIVQESPKYAVTSEGCTRKLVVRSVLREDQVKYSCIVEDLKTSSKLEGRYFTTFQPALSYPNIVYSHWVSAKTIRLRR